MTAPTRPRPTRTARPERAQPGQAPRTTPTRGDSTGVEPSGRRRSAAAERAYARRAQREGRVLGIGPEGDHTDTGGEAVSGRVRFVVLVIALLAAGVAATLWLSTQAITDSYRLDHAKKAAGELAEQAEHLQREVTRMESAADLAQRAKELGMVPVGDTARLVVQPDGSVVVVGEPKAAVAAPPVVTSSPVEQPPAPPGDQVPADQAPADGQQTPPADPAAQAGVAPAGGGG